MLTELKSKIFKRTKGKKIIFFLIADILLISFSCFFGFFLRFDGAIEAKYFPAIQWFIIMTVPVVVFLFYLEKLYYVTWSFISIKELLRLTRAVSIGFMIVGAILFILKYHPIFKTFPRSIIFISAFLVLFLTGAIRFSKRIYLHGFKKGPLVKGRKTLIFGAGDTGEQLVRYIINSRNTVYHPFGFVDDSPIKKGAAIHSVRVIGKRKDIPGIIKKNDIKELIIALPTAPQEVVREAVDLARSAGLQRIKIIPSTKEILEDKVSLNRIRDISIEDLLGREVVNIDTGAIQGLLHNKKVLVTGASGSIGSCLCEEILSFSPEELIVFDQDETGIFNLEQKLNREAPNISKSFIVGNICDHQRINHVFEKFKPDIVFHAAAYKHVPLMEAHPDQAVKNNIFGLKVVAEAALKHGIERLIFISTDKAVNPSSVMGMTKRMGEMLCQVYNQKNHTKFISVRFGNVLNSRGSVIPTFREQIKRGGPIEITHPDMKRYFMVTSEAVLLVMQAGAMGGGGEVFVLDMGEPVKIIDLAKEMIKLSGFEPDKDIPIVFTNPRPGEKFFEDILTAEEGTLATKSQNIFIAKLSKVEVREVEEGLKRLESLVINFSRDEIISLLKMFTSFRKSE